MSMLGLVRYFFASQFRRRGSAGALREVTPASHLLMGFDFPYMDISTVTPLIAGLHLGNFSASEMGGIEQRNASALFPRLAARLSAGRG